VENADFVGVKHWVWIKELENNIIKKTSGFIRKYAIFYLFFDSVKKEIGDWYKKKFTQLPDTAAFNN
jgi:hypothetical protein